jgi:hypothetical protein
LEGGQRVRGSGCLVEIDPDLFARSAYTTGMFDAPEQLAETSTDLIAVLGTDSAVAVTMIPPVDRLRGHA